MNRIRDLITCLLVMWLVSCNNKDTLFHQISSSHSGIHFNNEIIENDSINPLDIVNIYNGGGVGIGDFNNDGLADIYFAGNMVMNRLYLNKGDFVFDDITEKAGVTGDGRWGRGVSVIDINNDGLHDIYICNTIYDDSLKRQNVLYINKGVIDGIPQFADSSAAYGLDIHAQSTMAAFFDYDNDGDLDMYLTVNEATSANNPNRFGGPASKGSVSKGRLYRNDYDTATSHIKFHDVSVTAGITLDGFGHGASIADINLDGWKDIYVSNDFLSDNILYINNHNGTFADRSKEYFKHTSYNAMGQDIVDINNDGLSDVVELDMSPEDNYRKKMMLNASNTTTIQNFDLYGHQYQYVRNTVQLNQGPRVGESDTLQPPAFSEISYFSGVAQTDWSWAPIVTDFDNDSYRDIIITNGFPKDVSDHDFMVYNDKVTANTPKSEIVSKIPQIKLRNYAYRNNGDVTFTNATFDWGLGIPSFSTGAAYVDLDNNGTMDLVINNINDEAFVYRNIGMKKDTANNYLQIRFKGDNQNIEGIGTWADIYYDNGKHQAYENTPYRGYLSTMARTAHFGLGKSNTVDSVVIRWTNGKKQTLSKVKANQSLEVNISNADQTYTWQQYLTVNPVFKEITKAAGIDLRHIDVNHIDFNIQTTLPHKLSEYSPALAAADLDGDGLDDLVVGGNSLVPAQVFFQEQDGKFSKKALSNDSAASKVECEDAGILLFDANNDGATDVYIASGGYRFKANGVNYQDRLYINNGKGLFTPPLNAIPPNQTSKQCVRAIDYNNDGRLDIFVSGRVDPWQYPKPVSSFIFRNDSDDSNIKFTDVSDEVAPALKNIGMVCDALYTDFDNDNQRDLILTGEWMPVTLLKNVNGKFINVTEQSGLANQRGWWNSIVAGDFRHTGRIDYIVGNIGLNTFYQASHEHPVYITAKDFDGNGGYDAIPSLFLADRTGELKEFPAQGRDEVLERMPAMKKRFLSYKSFATATFDEIFPPDNRKDGIRLNATNLQSCYLRNEGNGKFTALPLPKQAQLSAINGMVANDFDDDGNLDVLINGNDFGTEVTIGRYDALNGLLLKGDGAGTFTPLSIQQSGIYIPGNGRALVELRGKDNFLIAASQNKDFVKMFSLNKRAPGTIQILPNEVSAVITYKSGKKEKREFYFGTSFLSQSARFIKINTAISSVDIIDNKGHHRSLQF